MSFSHPPCVGLRIYSSAGVALAGSSRAYHMITPTDNEGVAPRTEGRYLAQIVTAAESDVATE